jgi:hypothetical protein
MDVIGTVIEEIVGAISQAESGTRTPPHKRRRAIGAAKPRRASPAAATENASALQQEEPIGVPRSRRQAIIRPTPMIGSPAAPIPAQAGADEANTSAPTNAGSPRRRSTRAVQSANGNQKHVGSAAGRAIELARTDRRTPDPTIQNDAGQAMGATLSYAARVRRRGHKCPDSLRSIAAAATIPGGHLRREPQFRRAIGGDDGARSRSATPPGVSPVVAEIVQLWRMRQRWHRAEKALTLQGKALCRAWTSGDKEAANALFEKAQAGDVTDPALAMALMPFLAAIGNFEPERTRIEKELRKLARATPVYPWAAEVPGFGELGLAAIIGEASVRENDGSIRTLGDYRSPSGLWKRMGLAVIRGERQRRVKDKDLALEQGYSPARRSAMWNIGGGLIGGMGKGPRPRVGEDVNTREDWSEWQKLFVERLRYLAQRDPDEFARDPVTEKKTGDLRESFSAHAAASAKRYVEKRFLRRLWSAWRDADRQAVSPANPTYSLPAADRGQSPAAEGHTATAPVGELEDA